MDDRINFDINESLKLYLSDPATIPTPEANSQLVDCEADPESLTLPLIDDALDPVAQAVGDNPDGLMRGSSFDTLQFLLKCAPISCLAPNGPSRSSEAELFTLSRNSSVLPAAAISAILDLLVSGLSVECETVHQDIETDEQDVLHHHKRLLEMYAFLLQWAIAAV